MADLFLCEPCNSNHPDQCQINFPNNIIKQQKSCANLNFPIDIMNSTSLPNSPSRDNINAINNLLNSEEQSLSNSMDNIVREPATAEIEFLSSRLDNSESLSSKSQSSFNNMLLNNQKRKKSTLFSSLNNYRNKVISFKKIFSDSDATNDQLLGDYSCALAKSTHGILIQGRLYVTEKWICFYSKIMSFENKIILPISGITNVSKEKTAKVIPNAIQITTKTGKYFFTSFASRERSFTVLQNLLLNHKNRESLNNVQKKVMIHDCYGSECDMYISEECNINQGLDLSQNSQVKSADEMLENEPPSFVVGDDSDFDSDQSLYSTNLNHPDEIGDHLSPVAKQRKKKHKPRVFDDSSTTDVNNVNLNYTSAALPSTNESNADFRTNVMHNLSQICSGHDHFHRIFLDEEIDMHVDRLFTCLFTNSSFFRRFTEYRKTFDIVQTPWPEDCDANGVKERTIYYTITMKAKIGPKISTSEEKQIIHGSSQPGLYYIVDTIVRNGGFPLSDCFHCINRYCLIHVTAFKSKLKVTSQVVYDKSIFFASKSLIESTAKSGLTDYFTELASTLKHEAKGLGQHLRQLNVNHNIGLPNLPKSNSSKLANEPLRNQSKNHKSTNDSKSADDFTITVGNFLRPDRAWLILIMLSLIICLCLSFLYSRFRQLEEMTNIELNRHHHYSRDSLRFDSSYDWKAVLRKQQQNQMEEISQWKSLVDNSIDLIDQMRQVLVTIKVNLENLDHEIKSSSFNFENKGKAPKSS